MNETKTEKPVCKLIGIDGNVFAIISKVRHTLESAGMNDQAEAFAKAAFASYNEVLRLCSEYVDVK